MKKKQTKLKVASKKTQSSINVPSNKDAINYYNLGNAHRIKEEFPEAEINYRKALELHSDLVEAHYNLGITLSMQGKIDGAEMHYRQALQLNPNLSGVHYNLANGLRVQNNLKEAEIHYRKALELNPNFAEAYTNLGVVLMDQGDMESALLCYKQSIEINPNSAESYCNLGIVQSYQGNIDQSEKSYLKAINLNPNFSQAYCNLGNLLKHQGKLTEAEENYRHSIEIKPDYGQPYNNLGLLFGEQKRYIEAEDAYKKALFCDPSNPKFLSTWIFSSRRLCDWKDIKEKNKELLLHYNELHTEAAQPIALLATAEFKPLDVACAGKLYAINQYKTKLTVNPLSKNIIHNHKKLRIGYLSADFHSHATVYLVAGILENRDKELFDVYLYSYGVHVKDDGRSRVEQACEVFLNVRELTDEAVAQQILSDEIDILVDLKGYTQGERLGITALRPAPVIVSWLGYPGTLGHERLADYIIGDSTVTPVDHAEYYSEKLALMPHCYQPNDNKRTTGERPTRTEVGLPEKAFVFCTFNQAYKITPDMFDIWCCLLGAVSNSILWVLAPHEVAQENLSHEMELRGIAPTRLIFAPHASQTAHLGRLQLADLAVDTFPYTSHTTASDALWAGVPLVTKMGETFASRVAASILNTMDLSELVTTNDEDYFNVALSLAQNPEKLAAIKQKIAEQKQISPLFNTQKFARDLERLYQTIWEQELRGERKEIVLKKLGTQKSLSNTGIHKPTVEDQRYLLLLSQQGLLPKTIEIANEFITRFPTHSFAWKVLGSALRRMGRIEEALDVAKKLIEFAPNDGEAYYNLGNLFTDINQPIQALKTYEKAFNYLPENLNVISQLLFTKKKLCYWKMLEDDKNMLISFKETSNGTLSPFFLLAVDDINPINIYKSGRMFAESTYSNSLGKRPLITNVSNSRDKLRIGYLSADFHSHATVYLMVGILENRDTESFDIYLYSYGVEQQDISRSRIENACEVFRNVRELSDETIATQILADEIDILIDLKGYTTNTRLGITALRPAPVIVSWLGYPGTLGHERLADYIIGDPIVTPLEQAEYYSETLALMPHCYQPNDNKRPIGVAPTRTEVGLPENAFVFCTFNQAYKITPDMFDVWCRLLNAIPESVLWLLEPHPAAQENLRREIEARGIESSRLIFAPKIEQTVHLGRLQLADLAVDTFPYTSHTTASDALWAGVPLVTKMGETFASRVAASILNTMDLSELVTTNDEDYFNVALSLAQNPEKLAAIKQKIEAQKQISPLFDTQKFAQDLERLYQTIWEQELKGERKAIVLTDEPQKEITTMNETIEEILKLERLTEIVDIGANPIDGDPPYKPMLSKALCNITGFEPQELALAELLKKKSKFERYLPYAVGDGNVHTLNICRASGMTSLFEPDATTLELFDILKPLAEVTQRIELQTRKLDEIIEIEKLDFLKIDI